jgi:hypothetical protein
MLHLHEGEFQVLAGHGLIKRGSYTFNLSTRLCDYCKSSRVGIKQFMWLGHAGIEQQGKSPNRQ